jgi:Permuted papain-like amidase enzyme, YaeF/YiiX, C92 family
MRTMNKRVLRNEYSGMRSIIRYGILAGLFAVLETACARGDNVPPVRDGDVIFQTSRSSQSLAIQHATGSPYSHMGLVLFRDHKPYVFEAIATVRFTPLDRWIARGAGQHFVLKRLRNADTVLNGAGMDKLRMAAERFAGRPYDLTFDWSDDRIYCSELVWKAYDRGLGIHIGTLQTIRDFNLTDPAVSAKLHERYGDNIPLGEPVISPVSMFRSTLLVTVAER